MKRKMGWLIEIALVCVILYLIDRYFMNYWKRRGFPQENGSFMVGNIGPLITVSKSVQDLFGKIYTKNKHHRFVGFYEFYRPSLLIIDTELIQNIMIRDFNNFHDHGPSFDEVFDPLVANLFSLTGQKWRDMRVTLSPSFTSGKLRNMFPHIKKCASMMSAYIEKNMVNGEYKCDAKDLFSRYQINIISSVAFGVENDSINDRNHSFYTNGIDFFKPTPRNILRFLLFQYMPSGMKLFGITFAPKHVGKFFMNLVAEIVDYREKYKITRNDFMDLMIKLKNDGYIPPDKTVDDENEKTEATIDGRNKKLTFNEIAAQAFVFFLAAFETAGSAVTFCLFELARNPKIQQKVHEEIDKVLNSQEVTYDSVKSLKYLECCILEALRKYSPVPLLSRYCTADYKIPNTDLVIAKGTVLQIPAFALQRDPSVYENPLEFRPERFIDSLTGNAKVKGLTFLSFGDGPRHCIGMRMAKLNLKLGLLQLLTKFRFELVDKKLYDNEIELDIRQFPTTPAGILWLKATAR